jgi:hypothetical protein
MKKIFSALLLFACCLFAADFWQSKPYTEWSEKDAQKMLTNSPWAKTFVVSVEAPDATPLIGGPSGAGSRGIGEDGPPPLGGDGGGRLGGGGKTIGANQAGLTSVIVARWQSAMPVKEAFVRLKYGVNSPEAKQTLDREETSYAIVLSGALEPLLRGNPEDLKRALINASFLSSKGKGAMKPMDIQISATPKATEVLFLFPRSTAYTLDDKEVEFSTKLGGAAAAAARYTFRLKDMVFNGKLEL